VMQRCERIIAHNLDAPEEIADEEFIISSLDLLAGLAGGLEGSMEALMADTNSQCVPLMLRCLTHPIPDVRQSGFALLGDLAKSAPTHLPPHLQPILRAVHQNLDPDYLSVCNNACWAVGELAVRSPPASMSEGAIGQLVEPLMNILCRLKLHKSLRENATVTLGRFGLVCPEAVAPNLQNFIKPWCMVLTTIGDDVEKEQALRGMAKMSYMNPPVIIDAWPSVCETIHSWKKDTHPMQPELEKELTDMLGWFKDKLQEDGQWDACHSRVSDSAKHGLQVNFGLYA
jgi:transportin-1